MPSPADAPAPDRDRAEAPYVSGVVVCVGRSEHLALTLANNASQVDEWIVVTSSEDRATQELVAGSAAAKLAISDRCYDQGHAFNKGRMINDGLHATTRREWVVLTDADIFLNPGLRRWTQERVLDPEILYGAHRLDVPMAMLSKPSATPIVTTGTALNTQPDGYFQFFHRQAGALRDREPEVMSESFCSAGGIDSWFLQRYPQDHRRLIRELIVLHIQHEKFPGSGWNGAAKPGAPAWRQFGVLSKRGWSAIENPPRRPLLMRFVATGDGLVREGMVGADGRVPEEIIGRNAAGELIFCGQSLGEDHIHVAWWSDDAEPTPAAAVTA